MENPKTNCQRTLIRATFIAYFQLCRKSFKLVRIWRNTYSLMRTKSDVMFTLLRYPYCAGTFISRRSPLVIVKCTSQSGIRIYSLSTPVLLLLLCLASTAGFLSFKFSRLDNVKRRFKPEEQRTSRRSRSSQERNASQIAFIRSCSVEETSA